MTETCRKYIMQIIMLEQQLIDSLDFANRNQEVQGEIALSSMPRLWDVLAHSNDCVESSREKISYVLRGFHDKNGRPMLEIEVEGSCQLRCQRCLEAIIYPLKMTSQLHLVDRCDWDEFSCEKEDADSIPANNQLDVIALLEDEILLNLPFAPMHVAGTCRSVMEGYLVGEEDRVKENPFAVLSGMKKR